MRSSPMLAIAIGVLGTVLVIISVKCSLLWLPQQRPSQFAFDGLSAMTAWGGWNYREILLNGYDQDPSEHLHNAVFPPLYPLAAKPVWMTGVRFEVALLFVANLSLLLFLWMVDKYLRLRDVAPGVRILAIALISFYPYSFFFRVAYSESLFCLLVAAYFVGRQERWSGLLLAVIVSLAIVTRIVGVVLLPLLAFDIYSRSTGKQRFINAFLAVGVGSSAMCLFMLHLWFVEDDPLAFAKAQNEWTIRNEESLTQTLVHAVSLQPLWDAYQPDCECYWQRDRPYAHPLLNMQFMNPIVLIGFTALLVWGWYRSELNTAELYYSSAVIFVPYLTQGYRICLHSQCRYTLAAFPVAFVAARLLSRLPWFAWLGILLLLTIGQLANVAWFVSGDYTY